MLCLPLMFFSDLNLGVRRGSRYDRFQGIVRSAKGMLWNVMWGVW